MCNPGAILGLILVRAHVSLAQSWCNPGGNPGATSRPSGWRPGLQYLPGTLTVLLQCCSLGMRIAFAEVISAARHIRRRWHSLAVTPLAKHAAISCRVSVRHPSGGKTARPRRRRDAYTSRGDLRHCSAGSSARMSCSCTVVSGELRRVALAGLGARCRSSGGPERCGYRLSIM